ncbi:mannitol dehydrogenase family protein [Neorhizobium sp. JUb45]|uniref:mannitol dehydrogenase family protein n=1 Tax=unclassified Neorhizobium TaxID=2629175 RepID=UPI0010498168|nr:mannitol dehydrogenase family protein [Neorhizobium sp. JUb45]TCR03291.1 tagaturonate reductase [Neorhizobium sp. JUb45]
MTGIILQFGTSRFLQAHADFFLHEAKQAGQHVLPVVIVQTSGSAERAGRLAAFTDPAGFPVIIRGLEDGHAVERTVAVKSVERGLSVAGNWAEVVNLFCEQAEFILSNTGDSGYDISAEATGTELDVLSPRPSFPGKLAQLLHARFGRTAKPIIILPCELINGNGPVLKGIIRDLVQKSGADAAFLAWLEEKVVFANTLVDRIVSEPIEPVGAVAEPYALWAIERSPGLNLPCTHPSIVLTDKLEPFERLKLHILNLGHTTLADIWLKEGRPKGETVKAILADPAVRARLDAVYRDEVVPGFAARGMGEEAKAYVETTMGRFLNPYLEHRIADIAGNHELKIERRIKAFLDWAGTPAPTLEAIVHTTDRKTA